MREKEVSKTLLEVELGLKRAILGVVIEGDEPSTINRVP